MQHRYLVVLFSVATVLAFGRASLAQSASVTPTTGLSTAEDGTTDTFDVVLTAAPTADVTISLTSSAPDEGIPSPDTLTFTGANWDTPQTVTVTGVDDYEIDGDQTYSIVTGPCTSTDSSYNGVAVDDVDCSNSDDDVAGITVGMVSGDTTETGEEAHFYISLATKPTANVSVDLSSSDTGEGIVDSQAVTFTPDDWTPQEITVTGVDDSDQDGDVEYTIYTSAAYSFDMDYDGMEVDDVTVTNLDDEGSGGPTLEWFSGDTNGTDPDGVSQGEPITFRVTYTSPSNLAPTIHQLLIDFNGDGAYTGTGSDPDGGLTSGLLNAGASPPSGGSWAGYLLGALGLLFAAGSILSRGRLRVIAATSALAMLMLVFSTSGCGGDGEDDQACIGESGATETFDLDESDPTDWDYTDGKDYSVSFNLCATGTISYKFYFFDGYQVATGSPTGVQYL